MKLLSFLSSIILLPLSLCQSQTNSYYYDKCAPFTCGIITVAFPFSTSETFCGLPGFEIKCDGKIPTITLSGKPYRVNTLYRSDCLLTVSDSRLIQGLRSSSCDTLQDHFLPTANFSPLQLPSWGINLNFSWCRNGDALPLNFLQSVNYSGCGGGNENLYILPNSSVYGDGGVPFPSSCHQAAFPVGRANILRVNLSEDLLSILNDGFPLQWLNITSCWDCEVSGGRCGYNQSTEEIVCFCNKDGCSHGGSPGGSNKSVSWKVIIAAVVPTLILLAGVITLITFRKRASSIFNNLNIRSISRSSNVNVEEFIKNYRSMLPTEFTYVDMRKVTDGFKEKLGQGGYGSVFKGKLPNGQLVAVKILEKSKGNGRDFTNEVATIGRIHHINIIRLLGFCCDGSRRALVYEFMPRGSLGDLLSKEDARHILGVPKLLEIAVGIARGIEYLHQGCDKRILHLDIKPHNVLLDTSFHSKISDFGLAKSYSHKDSNVTLTGARGTIGYIAPEVFIRNLGGVSHKSDVYSYGMVLLEMIMGRKSAESKIEQSSKDYFTDRIYEQLDQWKDMELNNLVVEEDISLSRKMVMVGLWCIQMNPVDRPSATSVLEMLKGGVECIEMPPKPYLFSPPRRESEHDISQISGRDVLTYTSNSQ